jgi:signal transduction histidine kinase
LLLVQAPAPVGPGTLVSVVVRSADLSAHLGRFAQHVAVVGSVMAALTGLFVYVAAHVMIVRPIRRLTDSIVAFRADPERTPPLEMHDLPPLVADELVLAGHELGAMQRELRGALWRYARLAALGTAVAKVSHDLRSILAPALLSAERLQSHADPSVRRIGDMVVRAVERATELVRGGLEFAREGPTILVRRHFELREAIAEVAEQVRATSPALEIDNRVASGLEVDGDREQLCRVLANLLRNAGEAGAHLVTVDAAASANQTAISIADDGPGLPDRVRADLFKPFVTGGRRGSTGLGLAIARDLMRAHLGDIQLIETGPEGTGFRLILPATLPLKAPPRSTPVSAG